MIFRNWVLENFPFLEDDFDALTDYELFCKMMDYVKKFAKDNEEFSERLTAVENYVYNLDLQDEVDKKIQELLDDGTLAEIITSYLQIRGVLGFNRKNELKQATNLIDGSIAKTLGENSSSDGLGHFYKIRTIINTDVIDDENILALANYPTLVAVKIPDTLIGDLSNLKTTDKGSLVDAINENYDTIKIEHILKNKKTIIIGDSLDITGRWGSYFITYSGCDGENYGNGSAGFTSPGNTAPFEGETFVQMLSDIISSKTTAEKNAVEYLIVAGGINDALNNHTPTSIATAVQSFITSAKTNFPNAKIIIFPLHTFKWLTDTELSRYQAILDTCKNNGVMTTGDFLFWTTDDRTYDSGDHTHLSDTGYQVIANKILSWINGTTNALIETIDYTLAENWKIGTWFSITKRDNVVYIQGILHYTGGSLSNSNKILDFEKGSYITGSSGYNKYIPTVYYSGGAESLSSVNVSNGALNCGRPVNYSSLNNPYLYINGSFTEGIQGDISS